MTSQNMSRSRVKYKIVLESNRIQKDWDALEQEFSDRMKDCKEFLRNNPEDRTKAMGILKKLKGPFKGIIQYDITKDDARVWYRVNRKERTVVIKYAGHHPD
jgi:mRNA-degrading endonuclease RelE of RelBE toxin-antitoxin system